jgi:integrase
MKADAKALQRIDFKRRPYVQVKDARGNPVTGLYIEPVSKRFYERPVIDKKTTWRRLQSTSVAAAQKEMFRRREQLAQFLAGEPGAKHPYRQSDVMSVEAMCDFYVECGCPKRKDANSPRTEQTMREEKRRVETLKEWWGKVQFEKIEPSDCHEYRKWRVTKMDSTARDAGLKKARGKGGDRAVDTELITLSNVFWWAVQNSKKTGITKNPLQHNRPRFRSSKVVKHCRDFQTENGDELHAIARMFFESPRSEVLGWQCLLEAMVGSRSHELLKLRWDAKNKTEAGFLVRTKEGRVLYLYPSLTTKGTSEFVRVHPALDQCLDALKAWRNERYPESPWFLPSPEDPSKPIGKGALTHALVRITKAMGIPPRTSHGLRSYFVNVLRSQQNSLGSRKYQDGEIATMIGQKSGGKLIVDVYGSVPLEELRWMPSKGKAPAWEKFKAEETVPAAIIRPGESYIQTHLFEPTFLQTEFAL